ncbi:MAG: hydantoinase/oxoprolinase family protein [Pseudomonadota bacterium]
MSYRIGADIGGTFTDLVLVDDQGHVKALGKVLSTPAEPDRGVVTGVIETAEKASVPPGEIGHMVHGTTLFTNALIERKGARTALITTRGFRDAIEIAREHRYDMYDLMIGRPDPIAPRDLRFEVTERLLADGSVLIPLEEDEVRALAKALAAKGVEAIAVCLLHSYRNAAHEARIGEILAEELPDIPVALSSDVVPEIREYDRTSTTLCNVYVQGIARSYLGRLKTKLSDLGMSGGLYVMQSHGGICDVDTAERYPIRLVESGPAAGALAAARYGAMTGMSDILSFDMGGTTAKACLIVDGEPLIAPEFEVDRQYRFAKGSGLPVKVSVIEMIEIGAGGGSIARIDGLERLAVGPQSAGADPGPVCYGQGGTQPTVTDADLVLGYLDPAFFLGGSMALDVDGAKRTIEDTVGKPRGIGAIEAAWGIHRQVNEMMASAARIHAIERGQTISRFPMFAFGGAGPVHAYRVAEILRLPKVVYPLGAGVMSAVGFLSAPLGFDYIRSLPGALDEMDWDAVNTLYTEMEHEGRSHLEGGDITAQRAADVSYRRQGYELRVPVPNGPLSEASVPAIREAFEAAYGAIYGHTMPDAPIDVLSWRATVSGAKPPLGLPEAKTETADPLKGTRQAYMPEADGFTDVPVYDRYALKPGAALEGPGPNDDGRFALLEDPGSF